MVYLQIDIGKHQERKEQARNKKIKDCRMNKDAGNFSVYQTG
jgi:hypothetical protein